MQYVREAYEAILEARQELAAKHLPGRHNQASHGRGGGGRVGSGTELKARTIKGKNGRITFSSSYDEKGMGGTDKVQLGDGKLKTGEVLEVALTKYAIPTAKPFSLEVIKRPVGGYMRGSPPKTKSFGTAADAYTYLQNDVLGGKE